MVVVDAFEATLKKNISLNYPLIYIKGNDIKRLNLKLESICAQLKIKLETNYSIASYVLSDESKKDESKKVEFQKTVLLFTGSEEVLRDREMTAIFNDIVLNGKEFTIVILSDIVDIPIKLRPYSVVLEMPPLTPGAIKEILETNGISGNVDDITNSMSELSSFEITQIIKAAKQKEGYILQNLSTEIIKKKHNFFNKDFLEFVETKEIDELGGFTKLKNDIDIKCKEIFKDIMEAKRNNTPIPKGFMLVGIPGCGKSLAAKFTAKKLQIPLLKMDFGRMMNKYVGESEANLYSALRIAEASAPCVLWLDEFEKSIISFSESGADGNISNRLLGIFLNWLQEKKSPVFTIATVNNIDKMPPELLRRGRFDEIYKVDTPGPEAIESIFNLQLQKYKIFYSLGESDKKLFCSKLRGYSGADIEQIVSTAKQQAFSSNRSGYICIQDLYNAKNDIKSVEVVMHDQIENIRKIFNKYGFRSVD